MPEPRPEDMVDDDEFVGDDKILAGPPDRGKDYRVPSVMQHVVWKDGRPESLDPRPAEVVLEEISDTLTAIYRRVEVSDIRALERHQEMKGHVAEYSRHIYQGVTSLGRPLVAMETVVTSTPVNRVRRFARKAKLVLRDRLDADGGYDDA